MRKSLSSVAVGWIFVSLSTLSCARPDAELTERVRKLEAQVADGEKERSELRKELLEAKEQRALPPSPATPRPRPRPPPPDDAEETPPDGFELVAENHFKVERSAFDKLFSDTAALAKEVRVLPPRDSSSVKGAMLSGIRRGSRLRALGVRSGDRLISVGACQVGKDMEPFFLCVTDLIAKAKSGQLKILDVTLHRRRTEPLTLRFEIE